MSKNNLCNETCRIMFITMTTKSKLNSIKFQLGSLRMAQFSGQNTLYSFSSSALNVQAYSEVLFELLLKCTMTRAELCV